MTELPLHNEEKLLLQIAEGDDKAFAKLFYAYHHKLTAFVFGWTKSEMATEEIVQEVFLKIWTNRQALTTVKNFNNYLYILSRNYTFNSLRKLAHDRQKFKEWARRIEEEMDISPDVLKEDYTPLIEEAIAQLPQQQQKVFILKRYQHLKYEQIGKEMGISPETARKHMALATKNVTEYVQKNLRVIAIIFAASLVFT